MASLVGVGSVRTSSLSVRIYDDTGSGTPTLSKDTGGTVRGIAIDGDGNIYATGSYGASAIVYAWDDAGTQLWTVTVASGSSGRGVAVDDSGNAYVAFAYSNCLVKYNSSGSAQWTKTSLSSAYGVSLSSGGRVYVVGTPVSTGSNLFCYAADGSALWDYKVGGGVTLYGVAAVDDTAIYVVGDTGSSANLWKISRDDGGGTTSVAWSKSHGVSVNACAATSSGGVVIGGGVTSSITTRSYAADGTAGWTANHGAAVYGVAIDQAGNVYTTGTRSSTITTRKYNSSGTVQWSFALGTDTNCIATWDPGAIETTAPGLAVPLSLRVPSMGLSVAPAGIPLGLLLGVPGVTVAVPPDLSLLQGFYGQVYRLYLATEGLIELPLASIQCQRRLGASTWVKCQVPTADSTTRAQCLAHIGGEISIYAGVVDASGEETIGEFLRAVLTDVEATRTGQTGEIVLTGRVQNPSYTAASRTLLGVDRRGADGDRHTAACAVDPLLRPGDTVDDGVDTWIAGAIDYGISPTASRMTVTEDG